MNIVTVQTDNKDSFLFSEIARRKDESLCIVIFFANSNSLNCAFDDLRLNSIFSTSRVTVREKRIELGNNLIKFMLADWRNFCGMQYDVAICYDELEEQTYRQVLAKLRGANNFEKTMYILTALDAD